MSARARLAQTLFGILAATADALHAQAPISELRIEGCERYRREAAIEVSGLLLNEVAGRPQLEAAARKTNGR